MKKPTHFSVKAGDIVKFDVLTWQHEGYEFGRPCLMLAPVIREDSDSNPWSMIEDACIDICLSGGNVTLNKEQRQIEWRGWNLKAKRRRFIEALAGKKFPIAGYKATRATVEFKLDEYGELIWRELVGNTVAPAALAPAKETHNG